MKIANETTKTAVSGIAIIAATIAVIFVAFVLGGVLLYVPLWLIGEGHYLVGGVYAVFAWGAVYRLAD